MKKLILVIAFTFLFGVTSASAQTECPVNRVCITQEAANKAAENARLVPQLEEKVRVLEQAAVGYKEDIARLQAAGNQNVGELVDRLHKTEVELARTSGMLTAKEAELVRLTAWFDFVMKNGRVKKNGIINLF